MGIFNKRLRDFSRKVPKKSNFLFTVHEAHGAFEGRATHPWVRSVGKLFVFAIALLKNRFCSSSCLTRMQSKNSGG